MIRWYAWLQENGLTIDESFRQVVSLVYGFIISVPTCVIVSSPS